MVRMRERQPNIVLIVLDTARSKSMSLYGYERPTTPNLERLAEKSIVYTNCWSTARWTLPSHASLFTGLYPSEHGVNAENPVLQETLSSLPQILYEAGYHTVGISCNGLISRATGFARGFKVFHECFKRMPISDEVALSGTTKREKAASLIRLLVTGQFRPAFGKVFNRLYRKFFPSVIKNSTPYTRKALKLALHEASITDSERPLFLFLNLMQTHNDYNPPSITKGRFGSSMSYVQIFPDGDYTAFFWLERDWDYYIEQLRRLYDEEMAYVDMLVGDFLKSIVQLLKQRETWVFITSDHGDALGEGGVIHHLFYDEVVCQVPLVVYLFPGYKRDVQTKPIQLNDLFATIMDLAELPFPRPFMTYSLFDEFRKQVIIQDFDVEASLQLCRRRAQLANCTVPVFPSRPPFVNHMHIKCFDADGSGTITKFGVAADSPKLYDITVKLAKELGALTYLARTEDEIKDRSATFANF